MEGLVFIVITVVDVRRKIIVAIPDGIKVATAAGIGLFITYVGLSGPTDTGTRSQLSSVTYIRIFSRQAPPTEALRPHPVGRAWQLDT